MIRKRLTKVNDLILNLNEEELRLLNQQIIERLKIIDRAKGIVGVSKFNLGDQVSFRHHGERMVGKIIRLNQKTVSIILDNGQEWRVAPDFLRKIVEK